MSFDVSIKLCLKFIIFSQIIFFNISFAEDITFITADRITTTKDKSSNEVEVFSKDDIKNKSSLTLVDLLSHQSDLSVINSGPIGSSSSLFLRGTDSSHVLVLIDGIVMNDPSNPNRQFDIGRLSLNNVEKVEILKGSQGLSYGSNAIGGVVVITTKKALKNTWSGENYFDYGTFNTLNAGANIQRKFDLLNFSFGSDFMNTRGFSAANQTQNPNAEYDGDQRLTLDTKVSLNLYQHNSLELKLRYVHNRADLDKGGGAGNDDPNDRQKEEELYSKIAFTKNWNSGTAQTLFIHTRTTHYRLLEVLPDRQHPESSFNTTKGENNTLAINHTNYFNEKLIQNINFDFQHEKDQSKHFNQSLSAFIYHQYEMPTVIINLGLRLDQNKIFNEHLTHKLAAAYKLDHGITRISYSTGFRAPSINQLFDPNYGNRSLNPETSSSFEFSFDHSWSERLKMENSIFYTHLNNRLSYDNSFKNINGGEAEILGLEHTTGVKLRNDLDEKLSFTLLKTRDLNRGVRLARRPNINIKNILTYEHHSRHLMSVEVSLTGKRLDVDNSGSNIEMKSYCLTNINYRYLMNEKNEFYVSIKNLFDAQYEEIYGYGTGGKAITIGTHYSF